MIESLTELQSAYSDKLTFLYSTLTAEETVENILSKFPVISDIFMHREYTPFGKKRDAEIAAVCKKLGRTIHIIDDICLTVGVKTGSGSIYKVFTPFWRQASKLPVPKPTVSMNLSAINKLPTHKSIKTVSLASMALKPNPMAAVSGGRNAAMTRLKLLEAGKFADYSTKRDFPSLKYTTMLSAFLKFGCVSPREVFYAAKGTPDIQKQLYWRDFYYYILDAYPDNLGHAMRPEYDKIKWVPNATYWEAWKAGRTGVPIVDAGMRQMNATGFMHNRLRMIVSNFLIKDLHINWQDGEKYFAQTLVDYDPAQNNGGWQWSASTGTDSQPYFRIFNPHTQSAKFDKDAEYIKEWIPELKDIPPADIHKWDTTHSKYSKTTGYPAPIVDHSEAREYTMKLYAEAVSK